MSGSGSRRVKFALGIVLSAAFLALALEKADLGQLRESLQTANYWYAFPVAAILFFSHLLRAARWHLLLRPTQQVDVPTLFSSLIIGYGGNVVMPAHLGEVLRALVLNRRVKVPMGATLATILVERILDVLLLVLVMVLAVQVHPFPQWMINSGWIMLAVSLVVLGFLIFLRTAGARRTALLQPIMQRLPGRMGERLDEEISRFLSAVSPLGGWTDYVAVAMLSLAIWACYWAAFQWSLHAFRFVELHQLGWSAGLVLLAVTTVSVVVPSSPGYVGTYHYLCQMALAMFAVPPGPALSYAAFVHGVNFFPVLLIGLVLAYREGLALYRAPGKSSLVPRTAEPSWSRGLRQDKGVGGWRP